MAIQLLQAVLALLLAIQNNPQVSDATRAQVLSLAEQVSVYVSKPQVLGLITTPKDGVVWHAKTDSLKVEWVKALNGDDRWWNPPYVRLDLEGKYGKDIALELPITPDIGWDGGNDHGYTIPAKDIAPGRYRLSLVGVVTPGSSVGAWTMTPPIDVVIE